MNTEIPPSSTTEPLKFTIATVTFNATTLIERTIKSVEEQDYPHVEHLIVDGNSRDNTLEHIHHYQERNSIALVPHEISCISEPDHGLYDAMNKALKMATGDYILFLNAGDKLHAPTLLSELAAQIGNTRPAVIFGHTDLVDINEHYIGRRRLSPPEQLTWKSFKHGMLVCHQSFFAHKSLFRTIGYDLKYRFSADFDWCIRILMKAEQLQQPTHHAHCIISDYLNEGMTTKNHKKSLLERFRIMWKHYGGVSTIGHHLWFFVRKP